MPFLDLPPAMEERVVCSVIAAVKYELPANIVLAVAGQVGRVHFNNTAVLFRYGVAVKLEVHRALLCQRALRVERAVLAHTAGADAGATGTACADIGAGGIVELDGAPAGRQDGGKTDDGESFKEGVIHDDSNGERVLRA